MSKLRVVQGNEQGDATKQEAPKPPPVMEIEANVLIAALNVRQVATALINREVASIFAQIDKRPQFERLERLTKMLADSGSVIMGSSAIARMMGGAPAPAPTVPPASEAQAGKDGAT